MLLRRYRGLRIAVAVAALAVVLAPCAAHAKKKKKVLQPTPQAAAGSKQPDKELYDKALNSIKHGRYDVARLQLQALLNTYPDSEYQMRAKLAIGDSWYKEGGTAALTQAENEYKDFITFFPTAPEAAEAQMRVADIYYKQMEKPDRDYSKTERAEQEYRLMIQQFPDSPLVPRARQRLREVQEVLAQRLYDIGYFYSGRENWPATIARWQTLMETYPLYSRADETLVGLGDAYMAQAHAISLQKGPENLRSQLEHVYRDKAAAQYSKVLTRYPAAPGAAAARQRLTAMHHAIPRPTRAAYNESVAEQQSRAPVTLTSRALLLVSHRPQTLEAARVGEPDLDPPKPVTAPEVRTAELNEYNSIVKPAVSGGAPAEANAPGAPPRTGEPGADTATDAGSGGAGGTGSTLTVLSPGGASTPTAPTPVPPTPAAEGTATPAAASPLGDMAVRPPGTATPPVEKPAEAPDQVNEVAGHNPKASQPPAATNGKKAKAPKEEKGEESSSKDQKKKKKGLAKLNPF